MAVADAMDGVLVDMAAKALCVIARPNLYIVVSAEISIERLLI